VQEEVEFFQIDDEIARPEQVISARKRKEIRSLTLLSVEFALIRY